jgi:hypothetical protein
MGINHRLEIIMRKTRVVSFGELPCWIFRVSKSDKEILEKKDRPREPIEIYLN